MLKILGIVAGISAVALFIMLRPKKAPEPTEQTELTEEEKKEEVQEPASSGSRSGGSSGGGGGRRGGGSSGGGDSDTTGTINLATLEQHSTPNDCWVVIGTEVYNISGFIEYYPEQSSSASQYCGTLGFEAGFLADNDNLVGGIKQASSKVGNF